MSNTGECREIKRFTKENVLFLPSKFTQKLTFLFQQTLNKLTFDCFENILHNARF